MTPEEKAYYQQMLDQTPEWHKKAIILVSSLREWEGTVEELRTAIEPIIGAAPDPNAWGSIARICIGLGRLVPTGTYVPATNKQAKGRKIQVHKSKR
jgi:hypothetical protein